MVEVGWRYGDRPQILFDRRIPDALIGLLRPGGHLGGLAERAVRDPSEGLDLQLRGSEKEPAEGLVTLYVGLTMAFHLAGRNDGRIKVKPQVKHGPRDEAQRRGWTSWFPGHDLNPVEFMEWADEMIAAANPAKVSNEGLVQACVSRGWKDWFSVIDREVMFGFSSQVTKDRMLTNIRQPLASLVRQVQSGGEAWAKKGSALAQKLDALGVDAEGRILVIEVKPGSQTSTLAWTPYQVAQYVGLIRAWASARDDAADILNGMILQREQLGLTEPGRWRVASPLEFVPVIAVGLPVKSKEIDRRFQEVRKNVEELAPQLIDGLEVWGVEPPSGSIKALSPAQPLRGATI